MAITPIDIRNKEFHKGIRGYLPEEVDRFLDVLSKEFEALYAENFELKEKLAMMESELSRYKDLEATLKETMVLAQQTAEEVKRTAQQQAELILRESEQEKERILTEAHKKREEIEEEISELIRKREMIRAQLKSFLHAHLELTEQFAKDQVS